MSIITYLDMASRRCFTSAAGYSPPHGIAPRVPERRTG